MACRCAAAAEPFWRANTEEQGAESGQKARLRSHTNTHRHLIPRKRAIEVSAVGIEAQIASRDGRELGMNCGKVGQESIK